MKRAFVKASFSDGFTLLSEHYKESVSVVMGLWIPVGSRAELAGNYGVFHFLEHIVFKSPKVLNLVKKIEGLGGEVNAFTAHEHTCFYLTLLSEDIDLGFEFLSLLLKPLNISDTDFEKEKAVVQQEVRSQDDDIEDITHRYFFSNTFQGSSLEHPLSGSEADVSQLSKKILLAHHKKFYQNSNHVLSLVGAFNQKTIQSKITRYFAVKKLPLVSKSLIFKPKKSEYNKPIVTLADLGGLKEGCLGQQNYAKNIFLNIQFKPGFYPLSKKSQQLYLTLGFELPAVYSKQRLAGMIINSYLGNGMSSVLSNDIRENKGLVYFIHSQMVSFLDGGVLLIEASSEPKNMPEVIESIFKIIKNLNKSGLSVTDLANQKQLLKGQILLGAEDLDSRMHSVALNELIFEKSKSPEFFIKELQSVTQTDVLNYIHKYLDLSKISAVLVGPKAHLFKPFFASLKSKL